jgi:predicted mannosyl-3-phosphoglycerate phosphatase (HAD superfamily)
MMQTESRTGSTFPDLVQRSMVVLTCVDGALRDSNTGSFAHVKAALNAVSARGVSTVLASYHRPADLMAIQQELGLREPFIAELGRALYVPKGHFGDVAASASRPGNWDVFDFTPPSMEEAIDTLIWLYRVTGDSPLLVGVGASWSDRLLLRHVDVQVLIAADTVDHRQLRMHFPEAYVTTATGPDGWCEAMLGSDGLNGIGAEQSG